MKSNNKISDAVKRQLERILLMKDMSLPSTDSKGISIYFVTACKKIAKRKMNHENETEERWKR